MTAEAETDVGNTRRSLAQLLRSLEAAGLTELPQARGNASEPTAENSSRQAERVTSSQSRGSEAMTTVPKGLLIEDDQYETAPQSLAQRRESLRVLSNECAACTKCPELAASRTQTVFGVGNPEARLCFFGEAPGGDEDKQGEPFVGRAGQLLTKIIEACTLKRDDVYILNVLRCRPPGNRNPLPAEAANCRYFYESQLETIQPEFICCLGAVAATTLLETTQSIGNLRGRFHAWRGAKVIATYHPAYLLRNPSAKRMVWDDMKLLMAEMGIEVPT